MSLLVEAIFPDCNQSLIKFPSDDEYFHIYFNRAADNSWVPLGKSWHSLSGKARSTFNVTKICFMWKTFFTHALIDSMDMPMNRPGEEITVRIEGESYG